MKEKILTEDELAVMERIYQKFANYRSEDIPNYSHKEKGYNATQKGEIISYTYAILPQSPSERESSVS